MYTKGIQLYFPQRGIKVKKFPKGEFYSFFHIPKSNSIFTNWNPSEFSIEGNQVKYFHERKCGDNVFRKGNLIIFPQR
jgi:hypothetical protein